MLRFFSIFLVLLVVLFVGELTPPVQQWLIVPWTSFLASASAFLVQAVDTNVVSYGKVLQNAKTGMGVSTTGAAWWPA